MKTSESYTIISATNRADNKTLRFAESCHNILKKRGIESSLFSLQDLPENFQIQQVYDYNDGPLYPIVEKFIQPASKFIIAAPEYNGSYPGILKLFLDAIEPRHFKGKKALLIGTSSGRAGNLRGMDHLTAVLHYLKVEVYSQKLPISSIENLLNAEGELDDSQTIDLIENLLSDFQHF